VKNQHHTWLSTFQAISR